MARIKFQRATSSSITVCVADLDPSWNRGDRMAWWMIDDVFWESSVIPNKVTEGGSITLSRLSPSTEYAIDVKITFPDSGDIVDLPTIYASTTESRVAEWNWYLSNGTASAYQTQLAYNSVTSQGSMYDFSHKVWNDLVSKVLEVLNHKGYGWDNYYTSFSGTQMSPNDTQLLAVQFNSLRYNIGMHFSTGIAEVSPGDIIYGYYFTSLATKLNQWINQ